MELSVLFIFFITISVPITRSFEQWPHVIGTEEEKSLNCVRLFATPWTVAYQALQSMGFSRQEYWSGVALPSPGKPLEAGKGKEMDCPLEQQSPTFLAQILWKIIFFMDRGVEQGTVQAIMRTIGGMVQAVICQ